jgi:hypothetical protein
MLVVVDLFLVRLAVAIGVERGIARIVRVEVVELLPLVGDAVAIGVVGRLAVCRNGIRRGRPAACGAAGTISWTSSATSAARRSPR